MRLLCQEFREAERLIAHGLSGNPPFEIAEELRDLLEKLYLQWNRRLRQIKTATAGNLLQQKTDN